MPAWRSTISKAVSPTPPCWAAKASSSQAEAELIVQGLEGIARDLQTGALAIDPTAEDIHMFVEAELTSRLGDTGKRLHTARSRNDQVALDIRLYLRDQCQEIHARLLEATSMR